MKVLVLNSGSSSLKYKLFEMPQARVCARGVIESIGTSQSRGTQTIGDHNIEKSTDIKDHRQAVELMIRMLTEPCGGPLDSLDEIDATGHRVVHGGEKIRESVLINQEVIGIIEAHCDVAPLHNPPNLTGILEAMNAIPTKPHVACFDTAFHQTIPQKAYMYALPQELYDRYGIRRYGFHGTSHQYVSSRAAELLATTHSRLITCHLGNGCSIGAIRNGHCIDTSMGFTPLEGVVMGTRSGDFDPAVIFYLQKKGYRPEELDIICNKKSGLLGLSGISNDMRVLETKANEGDANAQLAIDIFVYRIKKAIGSYLALLDGCDALVFTGGIGERSLEIRRRILENMTTLGFLIDHEKNNSAIAVEQCISSDESPVRILVIPTDEEKAIAMNTYTLVNASPRNNSSYFHTGISPAD